MRNAVAKLNDLPSFDVFYLPNKGVTIPCWILSTQQGGDNTLMNPIYQQGGNNALMMQKQVNAHGRRAQGLCNSVISFGHSGGDACLSASDRDNANS